MPHSGSDFDALFTSIVGKLAPKSVLDIGVGAGKIGAICRQVSPKCVIVGIEAHAPYAKQFVEQWKVYRNVILKPASDASLSIVRSRFDLVVFGDVLEHMWLHEALSLLTFWSMRSSTIIAIWPTRYLQDDHDGVVSEIHRSEVRLLDIVSAGLDVIEYHKHRRSDVQSKNLVVIRGLHKPKAAT